MNDVNSFLISLQEFNRQFRRLNEFDVVSLWTRIRSWVRSLTASVRERGSILSPELAQEVWKLRGNLWKLNKSQRKETGLLWTIWETQNLCDDLNLFADFFEGVSAQYNLVKKMIEMEALHDASICSSKLYSQLTQKLNKSLNTSEAFVVNGEKYYGNDKATNVVVAVSLAVLTCGSKLFEIDSLKLYNAAVRSVELWIRQSHQIATFKTHLNSALYHVEKILGQLGSVIEKSSLSNFKCIANFIQSYFRICQLGDHSVSSGVSVFVTGLPLHLLTPVVWDCFSGLFFDQERDPVYQWDGLKLMNGVFQRILRVQRNDQVGPIRKLTQEYFTLKLDYLPLIPDWFAVHVSTALTLQITSTGKTPPINHTHLHHLQECLEKYRKFLKRFASLHNSQMVSIFTALGLLFYAIRSEQTAVQCWRNETQIADFITGVMILTAKCITAFPRKALMEAITAQKLPGYLSQYISSLIRVCLVSKEYRNLLGSHQESLWMLMELMMESLPDPDPGPGYRCLPRDLRLVMDSALDNVYTQKSHRSIPDSFDLYSFVIQLYFFVHQNWIQKRELQTQCLYSKIVDTVFHYSRQILKSESCSLYGMKLLKKVIPQLLECFPAAPVEDLKKLIGLYTRYSLQTINSSVDERLSYSWLFYKVPYEQEVSALKLFSQEVMAIMKHTKALKIDLNKLHHLKGFYFTSHGSPRNGISRTHQIRMKALIVVLLGYIDSMESDQVLQLLTECQWSLEHCSEREPFLMETKALCLSVQFLLSALQGVHQEADENLETMMLNTKDTLWAEGRAIIECIDLWTGILESNQAFLDPELTVIILTQCRALLQSRAWLHLDETLEVLQKQLCKKYSHEISESVQKSSLEMNPIPFLPPVESTTNLEHELQSLSVDDASTKFFQKKIAIQLCLAVKYREEGKLERAKKLTLDCRRFALGLYKSLLRPDPVPTEGPKASNESSSFTNSDAWIAQGLYSFCLLFLGKLLAEGDELDEARFVLKEAFQLVHLLRSRELFCVLQITLAQVFLRTERMEKTEMHLTAAMDCLREILSNLQYCKGAVFPFYLLGEILLQIQIHIQGPPLCDRFDFKGDLRYLSTVSNDSALLRLNWIHLEASLAFIDKQLTLTRILDWILDYVEIASKNVFHKIKFWKLLCLVSRWSDQFTPKCSNGVHVFGLEDLTDRFRLSLGLQEALQNQGHFQRRLNGLKTQTPDLEDLLRSLCCLIKDPVVNGPLQFRIRLLLIAWNGCQECPWILEELGKQLGVILAQAGHHHGAAYFLIYSQGNSIRLQTRANLNRRFKTVQETTRLSECLTHDDFQLFPHTSLLEDLDHECQKRLNQILVELGNLLVVCIVHLSHNLFMDWTGDKLVFVRYCLHDVPLIVAISSPQQKQLNFKQDEMQTFLSSPLNLSETVQEMSKILEDSKTGFENRRIPDGVQDKKSHLENWWRDRVNFDQQIKQRIQSVETELGPWKLLLSGHLSPRDASLSKAKSFLAKILVRSFFCSSLRTETTLGLTRIFLSGLRHLTDDHLDKLAEFYFQMTDDSETDLDAIYRALVESRESGDSREEIPDTNERICMTVIRQPRRRNRRFSFKRETSFCSNQSNAINAIKSQECMNPTSVLLVLDYKAELFPWESFNCYRNQSFYRVPNLCFARYLHLIRRHQYDDSSSTVVDFRSAFYVLDPEGDLLDSRETFQNWFQSINDWIGITPQQDLLLRFLQEKSVFLYFGHGAGEKHFNPRELRKYLIKSIGVLMGCSSAKLRSPGEGSILQYLAAGSCCCIGNLWIVSDAEINRFSKTLVSLWIHSTNQSMDVAVGVNRSRSSCRLTHLVGAAPVTYGIPTQIQFKERKNPLATPVHKFTS